MNPATDNPLSYIDPADITDVWVAGRQLLNDGKLVGIDEAKLTEMGSEWAKKIAVENTKK